MSLGSSSGPNSTAHSNRDSGKHGIDVAKQKLAHKTKSSTIAIQSCGEKPEFVLKDGDLECAEVDLGLLIENGQLNFTSPTEVQERQELFISDTLKAGVFRASGKKKKDGSEYLRKCTGKTAADIMQRRTYVVSPEMSILYKDLPAKLKKQFLSILTKQIFIASKARWPKTELKYMQIHDDTDHLHVDVWGTKGQMVKNTTRGCAEKDVLKFEAGVMAAKGAGHGAVFLDRKKRVRGKLHKQDDVKLNGALDSYSERVKNTKKEMNATPDDISWHREIDAALRPSIDKALPKHLKSCEAQYASYCDKLDNYQYGLLDLDEDLKLKELQLGELEVELKGKVAKKSEYKSLKTVESSLVALVMNVKGLLQKIQKTSDSGNALASALVNSQSPDAKALGKLLGGKEYE